MVHDNFQTEYTWYADIKSMKTAIYNKNIVLLTIILLPEIRGVFWDDGKPAMRALAPLYLSTSNWPVIKCTNAPMADEKKLKYTYYENHYSYNSEFR